MKHFKKFLFCILFVIISVASFYFEYEDYIKNNTHCFNSMFQSIFIVFFTLCLSALLAFSIVYFQEIVDTDPEQIPPY